MYDFVFLTEVRIQIGHFPPEFGFAFKIVGDNAAIVISFRHSESSIGEEMSLFFYN